jgi:hypothetical protein
MADDPALIWQDQPQEPPRRMPRPPAAAPEPAPADEPPGGRVTLQEAHHQFGVSPSTLASWARAGTVDAVKQEGRWMVTPASVAARLSERRARRASAAGRRGGAPGPTADGNSMLVPRDAWDKLLDQLGNLHEAGQMLADARERAAKAETEATFLRERLAELRGERDELKGRLGEPVAAAVPRPGLWARVRRAFGGAAGQEAED